MGILSDLLGGGSNQNQNVRGGTKSLESYANFGQSFLPTLGALVGVGGPGVPGANPTPRQVSPMPMTGGVDIMTGARDTSPSAFDPSVLDPSVFSRIYGVSPMTGGVYGAPVYGAPVAGPAIDRTGGYGGPFSGVVNAIGGGVMHAMGGNQSTPGGGGPTDIQNVLENLPGYQFQRDQAIQAITRNAAASGFRGSGNVLYDLANYSSGLASSNYSNYFNQIYNLANMGLTAAGAQAGVGLQQQQLGQNASQQGSKLGAALGGAFGTTIFPGLGTAAGTAAGSALGGLVGGIF